MIFQCYTVSTKKNKKHIFWFHKPHGAQVKKGEDAGWCRGLEHKLRETGMLSAR